MARLPIKGEREGAPMLKRYYSLSDAAAFLASENLMAMRVFDVLELACRGEIRLCFWFDGELMRFGSGDFGEFGPPDPSRYCVYSMKGYIRIPLHSIGPFSEEFEFEHAEGIEIIRSPDGGFPVGTEYPDEILGKWAWEPDDMESLADGSATIIHVPFVVPLDEALVPAVDLLGLARQKGKDGARHRGHEKHQGAETRARDTLLTIIAALADQAGIDPSERGAAARIAEWTEHFGAAVSDDTVRKILTLIPEAIERRSK